MRQCRRGRKLWEVVCRRRRLLRQVLLRRWRRLGLSNVWERCPEGARRVVMGLTLPATCERRQMATPRL